MWSDIGKGGRFPSESPRSERQPSPPFSHLEVGSGGKLDNVLPASPREVVSALLDERDEDLIGLQESQWFDAKSQPYRLGDDRQKWELAKDVSAMANAERSHPDGAVIVIAAKTKQEQAAFEEHVVAVRSVDAAFVNLDQYRSAIQAFTFPPMTARVDLHTFPRGADKVLVAIHVAPPPPDERPVMVRTRVPLGSETIEVWAIARRVGTATEWIPGPLVWADIRDGRRARENLSSVEPAGRETRASERVESTLERIVGTLGAEQRAVIALSAVPPDGAPQLRDFYGDGGTRGVMKRISEFGVRHSGFGLGYGLEVTTVGRALVDAELDRRALWVEPDGFTMAVAVGSEDMLGWASGRYTNSRTSGPVLRVNRHVIVEWPFEFARFVRKHVLLDTDPRSWRYWVAGRKLKTGLPSLTYSEANDLTPLAQQGAVIDNAESSLPVRQAPEEDAFELVSAVLSWFGVSERVPFAENGRITEEAIQQWDVSRRQY